MKRPFFAAIAIALFVGLSATVDAHEGHDHGDEPHNHASPSETGTPPAPPSDTFVPESRPLESRPPANQERIPNDSPNRDRQPFSNRRDFSAEPLEFGPPRNAPPLGNDPSNPTPRFDPRPNRIIPDFEPAPRDSGSSSCCPLGRSHGQCPSARCDSWCPNASEFSVPRPCPYGRGQSGECAWERNHRHGQAYDAYQPLPPSAFQRQDFGSCPTGDCGHSHQGSDFRSLPPDPSRQSVPFYPDGQTDPSAFRRFDFEQPRTFRN